MAEEKHLRDMRTVWWQEDANGEAVCMIDQSLLPGQVVFLTLRHEQQVAEAISTLKVRGAPAIGVTAAFGLALALARMLREREEIPTLKEAQEHLRSVGKMLENTRPTAVNLRWAIERMLRSTDHAINEHCTVVRLAQILKDEAQAIADEDFQACMN